MICSRDFDFGFIIYTQPNKRFYFFIVFCFSFFVIILGFYEVPPFALLRTGSKVMDATVLIRRREAQKKSWERHKKKGEREAQKMWKPKKPEKTKYICKKINI